jgi:hypothetical protein
MYIGPDGALYVMDYYRQIIEHPEWLSDSVINSGALYNGHQKGRIYRIAPTNAPKMNWCSQLGLDKATTAQLVQHLTSNNIWWRRTAQRLLMDRKDAITATLLQQLLDTAQSPTATVHALWTMEGLGAIDSVILQKALHHAAVGVRENAIKIAELHISSMPFLAKELLHLQNDGDAKVRYQLLCTLGDVNTSEAAIARQRILMHDIDDKWVQIAALASAQGKELDILQNSIPVLALNPSEGKALFFANCAGVIGLSQRSEDIKRVIAVATTSNNATNEWWQSACLKGLSQALSVKGLPTADFDKEQQALLF